jgi:hypothetical protein
LRQVSEHIGRVAREEQTITFRTGVAVGVLLVIAAGAFAGISGIVVGVVQAEQAVYDAHNLPTVAIITNNTEGSYACCQQAACTCAEVAEEARMCGDMLVNMTEGVCNGGYRCCSQECDTCYHTCYNTCCSTCIGFHSVCSSVDDPLANLRQEVGLGGGGGRIAPRHTVTCRSVMYSYSCDCRACEPYDCAPYDCNCRCTHSVANQACIVECGVCYAPAYTLQFAVDADSVVQVTRATPPCGFNDVACLARELANYAVNSTHAAAYDPDFPQAVRLDTYPGTLSPSAGAIAGFVLLSAVGLAALVGVARICK